MNNALCVNCDAFTHRIVRIPELTQYVKVSQVPPRTLAHVRREAVRLGHRDSCAAAVRWAVIELARRLAAGDRNGST